MVSKNSSFCVHIQTSLYLLWKTKFPGGIIQKAWYKTPFLSAKSLSDGEDIFSQKRKKGHKNTIAAFETLPFLGLLQWLRKLLKWAMDSKNMYKIQQKKTVRTQNSQCSLRQNILLAFQARWVYNIYWRPCSHLTFSNIWTTWSRYIITRKERESQPYFKKEIPGK